MNASPKMFGRFASMAHLPVTSSRESLLARVLLAVAAANCLFQIVWFWRFHVHNITMDAVNYIGLARHLADRNWVASLHGYWSPLLPWLIAAGSMISHNWTLVGRLLTIGTFLLCLPLLYVLTLRLWGSRLSASFAVLWFSLGRGLVALSVGTILADFLLTACVLGYFMTLLDCLRRDRRKSWLLLGLLHAVAFLAKAFAMPWLAISTVMAVVLRSWQSPRKAVSRVVLAFVLPAIVWTSWGNLLKAKYGAFTTGYQLKRNLMVDLQRHQSHRPRGDDQLFVDTSSTYDDYMVGDISYRDLQRFSLRNPEIAAVIAHDELVNLPNAMKEVMILLTPGGLLALLVGLFALARNRARFRFEAAFAGLAIINLCSLIAAYCMLVFDPRYLLPIMPVLMAVASCFLLPGDDTPAELRPRPLVQKTALVLTLLSILFLLGYWASPFRTVDRDYEMSCYQVASELQSRQSSGRTLVTIGAGPYPDHGVGFEAGVYAAYFAHRRVIGMNAALPGANGVPGLVSAVLEKKADAIVVWGAPSDAGYGHVLEQLLLAWPGAQSIKITDPYKGEVATLLLHEQQMSSLLVQRFSLEPER